MIRRRIQQITLIKCLQIKNKPLKNKLIKLKSQNWQIKSETRPKPLQMSNWNNNKKTRLPENLRLVQLLLLLTMLRWALSRPQRNQKRTRMRLFQFLQINFTLGIRKLMWTKRKKKVKRMLQQSQTMYSQPLKQLQSQWPNKPQRMPFKVRKTRKMIHHQSRSLPILN